MSVFDRWVEALCLSIDRMRDTFSKALAQREENEDILDDPIEIEGES